MWLGSPKMPDNMRPDKVKLYVNAPAGAEVFEVMVDPSYPLAWRQGKGKEIVDTLLKQGNHLIIIVGTERTFLQAKGRPIPDKIKAEIAKADQSVNHNTEERAKIV